MVMVRLHNSTVCAEIAFVLLERLWLVMFIMFFLMIAVFIAVKITTVSREVDACLLMAFNHLMFALSCHVTN